MATYIKTLKKGNDQVVPRTIASAVTTSNGSNLQDVLNNISQNGGSGGSGASNWSDLSNKPFTSIDSDTLKVENNVLKVNTTNNAEEDLTKPITSSGVYTIVGNINALLSII